MAFVVSGNQIIGHGIRYPQGPGGSCKRPSQFHVLFFIGGNTMDNSEIKREEAVKDAVRIAAWKLQAISTLFMIDTLDGVTFDAERAGGFSYLLDGIATDILQSVENLRGL